MVTVVITQPGASPQQLETEVTRKVEDAVATLNHVKRVFFHGGGWAVHHGDRISHRRQPAGSVERCQGCRHAHPHGPAAGHPGAGDFESGNRRLAADLCGGCAVVPPDEVSWFVDRYVARTLYGVNGVAAVTRIGGVDRQIRVDLRPQALLAQGITAGAVDQQLAAMQVDRPGGKTRQDGGQQSVRTLNTVADLGLARLHDCPAQWPTRTAGRTGRKAPSPFQLRMLCGSPDFRKILQ